MVRSANLRKFKSPLITDYFPYISVQKITHFLSNQSKSWCKFFLAPALLKPTPHKDFRRFFLLPTQCKNKHLPTQGPFYRSDTVWRIACISALPALPFGMRLRFILNLSLQRTVRQKWATGPAPSPKRQLRPASIAPCR